MRIFGLTGGIASGKSAVAAILRQRGVPVVDADTISRELSQPQGAAYDSLVARFGTADRTQLREIVFKDATARRDLEAILHPLIRKASIAKFADLAKDVTQTTGHAPPFGVYEATLLFESGRAPDFAAVITVSAPEELRLERLEARPGMTPEMARAILGAQNTDAWRESRAQWVIRNGGSREDLERQVGEVILGMATARHAI